MSKGLHSIPGNLQHFLSAFTSAQNPLRDTQTETMTFCHTATLQTNRTFPSNPIYCYIILDLCVAPRSLPSLTFLQHVLGLAGCGENNCINHSFCLRLTGDNLCCTQLFQRSQWEVVLFFGPTHREGLGIILEREKESRSGGLKGRKGWRGQIYTLRRRLAPNYLLRNLQQLLFDWNRLSQVLAVLILTHTLGNTFSTHTVILSQFFHTPFPPKNKPS